MITKYRLVGIISVIVLLLTSCTSAPVTKTTPTYTPMQGNNSIPTIIPPSITANTGAVKVTLISSKTNLPLVDALIRCATMLPMQGSMTGVFVPSLDINNSPWGNTDSTGTTAISNIKPGKYAMAYIFPIGAPQLIKLAGSDADYMFDIEAGKVLDLGTLKVNIDPNQIQ